MLRHRLVLLIALLAGLAAGWGVIELTEPPGPGLDPDAVSYLGAGVSMASGHGLRIPSGTWDSPDTTAALAHFPPGFSTAIAAGITAGALPTNAARFVEASAAAITLFALALAAGAAAGPLGALTVAGIIGFTPAMLVVHASVLSEPLFLALTALFVLVLVRVPNEGRGATRVRRLLALSVIAATASLVRYAGLALVGAIVLDTWLAHRETPIVARARRAVLAAVLPVLPFLLWVLSRPTKTEKVAVRHTGLYLTGVGGTLAEGWDTLAHWLVPGVERDLVRTVAAIAGLVAIALLFRAARAKTSNGTPTPTPTALGRVQRASALVAVCYLGMVLLSRLAADPWIPLDDRLLSPALVMGALAIGTTLAAWWQSGRTLTWRRHLTVVVTATWILTSYNVAHDWWNTYRDDGGDFAAREWRLSPVVAYAAALPAGTPLYTNWPAAIWFHTGRAARMMPAGPDARTALAFGAKVAREHAVVLLFTTEGSDVIKPGTTIARSGLTTLATFSDGAVWGAPH
jgi:hypothetical protein